MKRKISVIILTVIVLHIIAFKNKSGAADYMKLYSEKTENFKTQQIALMDCIKKSNLNSIADIEKIKIEINKARNSLKGLDFWFRYLEPVVYKKVNGPLPVEWETEVFEKFEKPYKREGTGLTLAALYIDEEAPNRDTLLDLVNSSINAMATYEADSITNELQTYHHFYLCNRLHILNLAAIYTTGFECPDTSRIIPELGGMMTEVKAMYEVFNNSFTNMALNTAYMQLYQNAISFVESQPANYSAFDHYTFIKDYVNPLYTLNQKLMKDYGVISKSFVDYSINKNATTIFDKALYDGQNAKGIFSRVQDKNALAEIDRLGKLLFYDPILSGNNQRSCASCHITNQYFTDTTRRTATAFDGKSVLARNTPSLINAGANHLIMQDGKHISLQNQTRDVMTNAIEMGSKESEILKKVLSCKEYQKGFTYLLKYTPQESEITLQHISSAITFYYDKFSHFSSPLDDAINNKSILSENAKRGFNLFMSRSQCATCHFVPQFNGIKPPYVSSEFEVLGVPADTGYTALSADKGRHEINPAVETLNAFRTGSIRNASYTSPYMHNGVFNTLNEVIEFYNHGGGAGRGLQVYNQTLSSDSLGLSSSDKFYLIQFIQALNENILFEKPPQKLPKSNMPSLNFRTVGGIY